MSKHPYNRKVFYISTPALCYSLREIRDSVTAGTLDSCTLVSDTDGGRYTAGSIAHGKAPRWAMTAEYDPMLCGLPVPSTENMAMVNEVLCEDDFLEMPQEYAIL